MSATFTTTDILDLYRNEAQRHGDAGTSTIQDARTRRLELDALASYIRDGQRVLEIGCGNGYVAQELVSRFDIDLEAVDLSPDMIDVAKERDVSSSLGRVTFAVCDVLKLVAPEQFDLIFTERCLQNLPTWGDQSAALANIASAMKPGGEFVMHESFNSGHDNLNTAREEVGLPPIGPPWHNLFFDEAQVDGRMAELGCKRVDQNAFLSGYYFGSRVLMPKLLDDPTKAKSSSVLNDFFCALPAAGDFCPMKIVRYRKDG